MPTAAMSAVRTGTSHSHGVFGSAITSSPYSSTSAALICSLSLPAAIWSRMNEQYVTNQ